MPTPEAAALRACNLVRNEGVVVTWPPNSLHLNGPPRPPPSHMMVANLYLHHSLSQLASFITSRALSGTPCPTILFPAATALRGSIPCLLTAYSLLASRVLRSILAWCHNSLSHGTLSEWR